MNCAESRLLLHAYPDGELDLVRSLELEKHVQTCAACAAEQQGLAALRAALRSAPLAYSAPPSLRRKLRESVGSPDEKAPRPWALGLWQLAASAMALAVLLLILRPAGNSDRDVLANEVIANHVRSLMPGHLTDVVSSDQHTVKPWFNGKLDFSPDVKDFAAEGFPLVGGRLDYLDGRTVSALVYRHNQHVINVFVWPANRRDTGKTTREDRHGYHLIDRDVNGLCYFMVSDLNPIELSQLADLIGK
jgi:anti-sigma factor RsiW